MKYSSLDILNDELTNMPKKGDLLGKLFYRFEKSSSKELTIRVPMSVYLRAQIFCEDIETLAESDKSFDQVDLIELLYNDFLKFAMRNPNPKALYDMLLTLERNSATELGIRRKKETSVFTVIHAEKKENIEEMKVIFRRKLILRGEILLSDLSGAFPDHGFTVENVLEYLYCDFINKFRRGDNAAAIKTILDMLDE